MVILRKDWQRWFNRIRVIGQKLKLTVSVHAVVGMMPERL